MNETLTYWWNTLTHSQDIIRNGGLILLVLIVYAENGLLIGFFLPGDYLLFSAGLLCGTGDFTVELWKLLASVCAAAILGSYTGFIFGKVVGRKLYNRKNSIFFKQEHLIKTRAYFIKLGGRTLIVGRFLPIVRTFAPIMAGVVEMDFKKFSIYNVLGGFIWVFALILSGYFLGQRYPQILNYLEYIILAFIILTGFVVLKTFLGGTKKVRQS